MSKQIEFGRTLLEALNEKYSADIVDKSSTELTSTFGDTGITVQMFGFEKVAKKQMDFDKLEVVGLMSLCISEGGGIAGVLPRVSDLDLSRNLIGEWDTVNSICCAIPSLRSLRLKYIDNCNYFNLVVLIDLMLSSRDPCLMP